MGSFGMMIEYSEKTKRITHVWN